MAIVALIATVVVGYAVFRGGSSETSWQDYNNQLGVIATGLNRISANDPSSPLAYTAIGEFATEQIEWHDAHAPLDCYRDVWNRNRSAFTALASAAESAKRGDLEGAYGQLQTGANEFASRSLIAKAEAACN